MEPATQETFRPRIAARLSEIEAELKAVGESTQPIAPDAAVGRLSRLDSIQMQQMALASKRRLEDERVRLNEAQGRIDAGNYGRCLQCGNDIAQERLELQPDAMVCMPCFAAMSGRRSR